ncbi:MAG: histidinol phosphate aminotransferase, histidinol-phosphate aminotransferase [Candidatus Peregrinibacteria bacterium GW2011_GWF2_39_17]|nr:MAG: histidinol phosphate aminotransferase, histidinol-phosphate aminotransferase [Candidatus Peregrinibacteria bacterium GW2011_GWF2_39_17]HCW32596.1 histidinol-phosphate transaminase [Candidatus Peregrinibacteria bacterium]
MNNLANSYIQKMKAYCPPLDNRSTFPGLRLDFNERTISPPPKVLNALKAFHLELYPEYENLNEQIANYASVAPEQIIITNGSDQGMDLIFRTFTQKGDNVIIPTPSFAMYEQCAALRENKILRPFYSETLTFPFEEIQSLLSTGNIKLLVLCNPNNPTGTPIALEQIEIILKQAPSTVVYVDEAYFEFSKTTAIPLLKDYPNLMITRTFSKAFGIPSLRIGYVVATASNIEEMLKVRGPYDVNKAGACGAQAALEEIDEINRYADEVMNEAKPMVEQFFSKNKINFFPSQGNFILFRPNDVNKTYEQLYSNGILTRPRSGHNIEGTIRFSIGTVSQMEQFIKTYQQLFL